MKKNDEKQKVLIPNIFFCMLFKTELKRTPVGHYIPVKEKSALEILEKIGKRVICEVNRYTFHCAIQ